MTHSLYMESTSIEASRTAGEITSALVRAGANQIATDFLEGRIVGLRWTMRIANGQELMFSMPARVEPVFQVIQSRRKTMRKAKEPEDRVQAERVAWRQLLRWVQAQLAMIETGMVTAEEVFFPYWVSGGKTLFEHFKGKGFKQLGDGR